MRFETVNEEIGFRDQGVKSAGKHPEKPLSLLQQILRIPQAKCQLI